jgi:hypothetical protein
MSPLPAPLSRAIQRRIDALDTDGDSAWLARTCRERLNAMPLEGNEIYLWALRADGAVLCMDFEAFARPWWEETDPRARYAVLRSAARRCPELRALVPPRPAGVQPCDACRGTGLRDAGAACFICQGLRWRMRRRPVDAWLARIDRGDRLQLRAEAGGHGLAAGRIAGMYVAQGDGSAFWCSPVDERGRHQLSERLKGYGLDRHVTAAWEPNPTGSDDPFESAGHALRFHGSGSGGSYEVEFARHPDGRCTRTLTLNHDFDPLGGAFVETQVTELDEAAARAEVEREMRAGGRVSPFPAVVPREAGAERGGRPAREG